MEAPILSGLDAALHELGMLSTVTESRCDYLREQAAQQRQALNVLHMNTQFVTGMVIGQRKGRMLRYRPYTMYVKREERARTKSENSDVDLDWFCSSGLAPFIPDTTKNSRLYKSRSLENVKVTVADDAACENPIQEVESVSNKIQQLQVCE